MLDPDARAVAFELIRPPPGHRLDFAVLTTYTLDLEALLVLPLSVLAHSDGDLEALLADPLRLHQAIREAGDRIHVFVDETGISIPRGARPLYSMLEGSVHGVRAPHGGAFHPKVWIVRFSPKDETADPLLRVAVLSRNLGFDRAWDVALTTESPPGRRRRSESRGLVQLLGALPDLTRKGVPQRVAEQVRGLADQVARTPFPAPAGFESPVRFEALGLAQRVRNWKPPVQGDRSLAIAPFVNMSGLARVTRAAEHPAVLISRQEELDKLPEEAIEPWNEVLVLADAAAGEAEDALPGDETSSDTPVVRPRGLHAKVIAVEHGWEVTWCVGSANLTHAGLGGSNVEVMASVTGRGWRKPGRAIEHFLDGGFRSLCETYKRTARPEPDPAVVDAEARLRQTRDALVNASLRVVCAASEDDWTLTLDGTLAPLPKDVAIVVWPVSVMETRALPLEPRPVWRLPAARLNSFIAFRLRVPAAGVDDIRFALRLPAEGMPADRTHEILRSLLDSPESFLRFLRALLGGLDSLGDWAQNADNSSESSTWDAGIGGESVLEDLLRTASRDPERLVPVRRLIRDLRRTEDGRRIVPERLFRLWSAVEKVLERPPNP